MKERRACIQCYKEHVQVSDCPDEAQFQRVNLHCTIDMQEYALHGCGQ